MNLNFKKEKLYSSCNGNIWGADLANMQLIVKYHIEIRDLFCAIDLLSKCGFVVLLKEIIRNCYC